MKTNVFGYSIAMAMGVLAGCASGPDYSGLRPGDKCFVSTEALEIHSAPDGLSSVVAQKKYGDPAVVRSVHRVAGPFAGDRSLFPDTLLPYWVEVEGGYVPAGTLVSDWLMKNQDPNQRISNDGMIAAKRGFSEEEEGDMTSMRGAAGSGKFLATADYSKLETVYAEQRKHAVAPAAVAKFVKEGDLAGNPVKDEKLAVEARGTASKIGGGLARGLSGGLSAVSQVAGQSDESGLITSVGQTASGLVWSESGPVQEFQLGESVAAKVLPAYKQVSMTDPRCAYLSKVAQSLLAASNATTPYRGLMVVLVEAKEVNAFAIPGGFLIVTTGMLDFLKDEDELAAIIGHEIGHLELGHGTKAVGTEKILKLFSLLKKVGTSSVQAKSDTEKLLIDELKQLVDEVFEKMLTSIRNGYGVDIESQADWRSLQLCNRLGYDTKALYDVLERFKSVKGTYGGAGYPEQRGADILKYRTQFSYADTAAPGRAKRATRYRSVVAK